MWMSTGQTSVQHLVMLQNPMPLSSLRSASRSASSIRCISSHWFLTKKRGPANSGCFVGPEDVADILAHKALDALLRLVEALDILLVHGEGRLLAALKRLDALGHLVVPGDVGDQVLYHGEGPHGTYVYLCPLVLLDARLAQELGPAVDLGATRAAVGRLAVPAHREIRGLLGLDREHGVENDHAFDEGYLVLDLLAALRVTAKILNFAILPLMPSSSFGTVRPWRSLPQGCCRCLRSCLRLSSQSDARCSGTAAVFAPLDADLALAVLLHDKVDLPELLVRPVEVQSPLCPATLLALQGCPDDDLRDRDQVTHVLGRAAWVEEPDPGTLI